VARWLMSNGNLVGINTLILSQGGGSEGLGFAIPAAIVNFDYQTFASTAMCSEPRLARERRTSRLRLRRASDWREAGEQLFHIQFPEDRRKQRACRQKTLCWPSMTGQSSVFPTSWPRSTSITPTRC
jgi:hypothetical protein